MNKTNKVAQREGGKYIETSGYPYDEAGVAMKEKRRINKRKEES